MPTFAVPTPQAFNALFDEIVGTMSQKEQKAWLRAKPILAERGYKLDDVAGLFNTPSSLFEFGPSEILELVPVILGTLKAAMELAASRCKSKTALPFASDQVAVFDLENGPLETISFPAPTFWPIETLVSSGGICG